MKPLITAQEAVKFFGKSSVFDTFQPALELADKIRKVPPTVNGHIMEYNEILGCIYWAGRVEGIREERQRKHDRLAPKLMPCPKCGKKVKLSRKAWIDTWTAQIVCECGNKMIGTAYGTCYNPFGKNVSYDGEEKAFAILAHKWNALAMEQNSREEGTHV